MYRILAVILIAVSGGFFLKDTLHFSNKDRIRYFNDEIVLDLLYKKRKGLAEVDLDSLKPMYSKNIVIDVVTPDGVTHRGGYRELIELLEDYARMGQSHEKTVLNHVIMVSDDGQSAIVRQEAIENWKFEGGFKNISGNQIETQRWILENGIPKIAELKKEQSISDPFFLQRRENQLVSDGLSSQSAG